MKIRSIAILAGLFAGLLGGSGAALAGGWAITSVDTQPGQFVAGETHTIEYTILQHGEHRTTLPNTSLTFRSEHGDVLVFPGAVDAKAGRHVAEVSLPASGAWTWTVNQGLFGEQELGALTVHSAPATTTTLWTSTLARAALIGALAAATMLLIAQALMLRNQARDTHRRVPAVVHAGGQ